MQLQAHIGELPLYQAAFLRNRSTDDHVFLTRRVLEERWRKGALTYVLSIDLRKAFDNVNLGVISNILREYRVPHHLINRIIRSVLYERTAVRWSGKMTESFIKGTGVKQGCPLSPYIFVLVLHYAMDRVSRRLGVDLNYPQILLPMMLAYADDILVLSDSLQGLDLIMNELIPELRNIGLEINDKKCELLIRDPLFADKPETVVVGAQVIKVVSSLKYLGIYLHDTLEGNRRLPRIKNAYKTLYFAIFGQT